MAMIAVLLFEADFVFAANFSFRQSFFYFLRKRFVGKIKMSVFRFLANKRHPVFRQFLNVSCDDVVIRSAYKSHAQ